MRKEGGRPPVLPVDVLREVVAREAAGVPLRRAAREIGLSPNGLRNFLSGAVPRAGTRMKLERWVAGRPEAGSGTTPRVSDLLRLLDAVGADLTPRQLRDVSGAFAGRLLAAYQERRRPPPRWVRELARRYGAEEPGR